MMSWSRVIQSYDEIPEIYKPFLDAQLKEMPDWPHIVLAPPLDRFRRTTSEKLIYDSPDAIHILERSGEQVIQKSYPYQSVMMLEVGIILLKSWITICGQTSKGADECSTIEFNTSSELYYADFLKKMRPAALEDDQDGLKAEQAKFDYLGEQNFKFMNYARSSLVAGDTVLQSVLQPEIRTPAWKLLGWTFHRTRALSHLSILTNHELIFIGDDERSKKVKGVRYGGVWQYIRLNSIQSVVLDKETDNLLNLVVGLKGGNTLTKSFTADREAELEQLRDAIQERMQK